MRIVDADYLYLEPVLIGCSDAEAPGVPAGSPGLSVARGALY